MLSRKKNHHWVGRTRQGSGLLWLSLFLVVILVSSCLARHDRPSQARSPSPTRVEQIVITSDFQVPELTAFIQTGITEAIARYGQPRVPIQTVHLGYKPSAYTTLEDEATGRFSIYLSRRPDEDAFWGQLAHEISHLLNARLFDCYVEGQSTVFSAQLVTGQGMDWSNWLQYFQSGAEPFYGNTYFLMREVFSLVDPIATQEFLSFAVPTDSTPPWMRIDMDRWIASLPAPTQAAVKAAIARYYPSIQATLTSVDSRYRCAQPQ